MVSVSQQADQIIKGWKPLTVMSITYLIHLRNIVFPFWQVRLTIRGGPGARMSVRTISGSELLPSFFKVYALIQILYSEYGSKKGIMYNQYMI